MVVTNIDFLNCSSLGSGVARSGVGGGMGAKGMREGKKAGSG